MTLEKIQNIRVSPNLERTPHRKQIRSSHFDTQRSVYRTVRLEFKELPGRQTLQEKTDHLVCQQAAGVVRLFLKW